ncbi:MAG: hybrid sensor histidine kinase/response regulator [Chloroflexi bacterium]|nr:hybrid sensor histidine kinase/response regulator [Chloroflexota bacterium]
MPKTLLLVDDEPQLLFSLQEYLRRVGYDVIAVESGPQALKAVMDAPPDLIVSDVLMEEMDGFELRQRLCALTGDSIPFVFLTAKGDVQDRVQALQNGADDYILKPFEPEELEARIASILNRIEQTRQEERRELDRLRSRILAEVSRQLRAPLTSLTARLNLMLADRFGPDEGRWQRYLESVLQDAQALGALVNDLSWAAAEAREDFALKLDPLRVAPIVRGAASNAARAAAEKGIELRALCGGLLSANIDGAAMTRALAGLLESAVDISPPGSLVQVVARRASEGGVEFTITDGGCGDTPKEERAGAWSPDALDFARRVVKGHGGRFSTSIDEEGRQSIILWLPGRIAKLVGKRD